MVKKWSKQVIVKDLEYIKNGENLFIDKGLNK